MRTVLSAGTARYHRPWCPMSRLRRFRITWLALVASLGMLTVSAVPAGALPTDHTGSAATGVTITTTGSGATAGDSFTFAYNTDHTFGNATYTTVTPVYSQVPVYKTVYTDVYCWHKVSDDAIWPGWPTYGARAVPGFVNGREWPTVSYAADAKVYVTYAFNQLGTLGASGGCSNTPRPPVGTWYYSNDNRALNTFCGAAGKPACTTAPLYGSNVIAPYFGAHVGDPGDGWFISFTNAFETYPNVLCDNYLRWYLTFPAAGVWVNCGVVPTSYWQYDHQTSKLVLYHYVTQQTGTKTTTTTNKNVDLSLLPTTDPNYRAPHSPDTVTLTCRNAVGTGTPVAYTVPIIGKPFFGTVVSSSTGAIYVGTTNPITSASNVAVTTGINLANTCLTAPPTTTTTTPVIRPT